MVKNSFRSIFSLKYFKKISLTIGFVLPLLLQGAFPLSAVSGPGVSRNGELQQKKITGQVTSASGTPLGGVTVVVKGTTTGIITDVDGNFSLMLSDNATTLVVSFIGMNTQEVQIGNISVFNITMEEASISLEEVVVVG